MTRQQKIEFLKETMTERQDIVLENLSDKVLDSAYRIQKKQFEDSDIDQAALIE